jgi:hypothetical protein
MPDDGDRASTSVEAAAMKRVSIWACVAVGLNPDGAARAADGPLVLDVWPGKAVRDHGQIGPERVRAAAEAPTRDAEWVTNVTRPAISVFRPDAGNNSRVAVVICPGGGYRNLAWDEEGEGLAAWLNTPGTTGVVRKQRWRAASSPVMEFETLSSPASDRDRSLGWPPDHPPLRMRP